MISIVVAHEQDVFRLGIASVLSELRPMATVATADTAAGLLNLVTTRTPSIAVVQFGLTQFDPHLLTGRIRKLSPATAILTTLADCSEFAESLGCRSDGYILREASADNVREAISTLCAGQAYLDPNLCHFLLRELPLNLNNIQRPKKINGEPLSSREAEVANLICDGYSNARIAETLGISQQTVKIHVKHILRKLEVTSRCEVVVKLLKSLPVVDRNVVYTMPRKPAQLDIRQSDGKAAAGA